MRANTNPTCGCTMQDLMMNGCPSAGGGACPSVVKVPTLSEMCAPAAQALKGTIKVPSTWGECTDCGEQMNIVRRHRGEDLCYYCEDSASPF